MTVDYTQPYPPPPPPPPGGMQPQKSQWAGCLKACGIGCGVLMIIIGVGIAGLVVFVFSAIKQSDVYTGAVSRAAHNPQVQAALGTPIEGDWWVMGNVTLHNDTGEAHLTIPIHGPKGRATINCEATRERDNWRYTRLTVNEAGQQINLLNDQDSR